MIRIKICGITNKEDAQKAISYGANALGFIFANSPREINPIRAKEIIRDLPPFVSVVGVFVNEKIETVQYIAEQCSLGYIQLHGDEPPEYCEMTGLKVIKVVRRELKNISDYKVSAFLIDADDPKKRGGTGRLSDWDLAIRIKKYKIPIILSGGLTPNNVLNAIKKVRPYGVDVSSGIEKTPGKKDCRKMKQFIEYVQKYD
jgi:phosphoribosylanthranilate isomerase